MIFIYTLKCDCLYSQSHSARFVFRLWLIDHECAFRMLKTLFLVYTKSNSNTNSNANSNVNKCVSFVFIIYLQFQSAVLSHSAVILLFILHTMTTSHTHSLSLSLRVSRNSYNLKYLYTHTVWVIVIVTSEHVLDRLGAVVEKLLKAKYKSFFIIVDWKLLENNINMIDIFIFSA